MYDVHSSNPDLTAVKNCFLEIKQWMTVNFLKLNDEKTEFIDIEPYVSPIQTMDLGDVLVIVSLVSKAKNLGFLFCF